MAYNSTVTVKVIYNHKSYEAICVVHIVEDHDYGADIDGNRGAYASWVDDIDVDKVYCITDKITLKEVPDGLHDLICEKAEVSDLEPDE